MKLYGNLIVGCGLWQWASASLSDCRFSHPEASCSRLYLTLVQILTCLTKRIGKSPVALLLGILKVYVFPLFASWAQCQLKSPEIFDSWSPQSAWWDIESSRKHLSVCVRTFLFDRGRAFSDWLAQFHIPDWITRKMRDMSWAPAFLSLSASWLLTVGAVTSKFMCLPCLSCCDGLYPFLNY